jgi:hypothetical protein
MQRRELLKWLVRTAPAVAATTTLAQVRTVPHTTAEVHPYRETYRGFAVYWRPWTNMINQDVVVGLYTAHSPDGRFHFYSVYPGEGGPYTEKDILDISLRAGQHVPTQRSTEAELAGYQTNARARLLKLIDQHLSRR